MVQTIYHHILPHTCKKPQCQKSYIFFKKHENNGIRHSYDGHDKNAVLVMGWQKVYVTLDSSMECELECIVWFISHYGIFFLKRALGAYEFHFGIFC